MDKLLKEAIADAKAVRETALANAKIALEEAFTPHLKSMLSKKLQAEMDGEDEEKADEGYYGEDEEEIEENDVSSEIGASDNKEPAKAGDTSGIGQGPESEGDDENAGEEDENLEKAPDQPVGEGYGMDDEDEEVEEGEHMDDEDEEVEEGEHMDDEDEDLEEVLRQLEAEMEDEDDEPKEEGAHMDDEDEDMKEEMEDEDEDKKEEGAHMDDEDKDMDEEIDLDEIIKALTEEEGMEDEDEEEKNEEMEDEDSELEEYKKTVQYLRDKLSEVNLLNAKLLYTNKLFRSRNVTEEQKMKVIEQFDRAANVREVKLVFSTFAESMKRKSVNESAKRVSQASKPTASTQPKKKPIIGENTDFKSRMKKLANII